MNPSQDIGRLEGKMDLLITMVDKLSDAFHTLESGRLSELEVKFATMATEVETKAKMSALWWALLASIVTSVTSGIILFLILHVR
jgi:hypothetical protein